MVNKLNLFASYVLLRICDCCDLSIPEHSLDQQFFIPSLNLTELHNVDLQKLYSLPGVIKIIKPRLRWTWNVAQMGDRRNAYRILVEKPEGKKQLERPRCTLVDNIKITLR
jgi:hypothetical protein